MKRLLFMVLAIHLIMGCGVCLGGDPGDGNGRSQIFADAESDPGDGHVGDPGDGNEFSLTAAAHGDPGDGDGRHQEPIAVGDPGDGDEAWYWGDLYLLRVWIW